jgi:hypothetical protein
MSHYKDLTEYEYFTNNDDSLNVGWLGIGNDHDTGNTPSEAIEKLREIVSKPIHLCRGTQQCEFCETNPPRGNGEIRVTDPDTGQTYASPVMILHYIEEHEYRPPEVFIQALLK